MRLRCIAGHFVLVVYLYRGEIIIDTRNLTLYLISYFPPERGFQASGHCVLIVKLFWNLLGHIGEI
jgi:hypothetical protein